MYCLLQQLDPTSLTRKVISGTPQDNHSGLACDCGFDPKKYQELFKLQDLLMGLCFFFSPSYCVSKYVQKVRSDGGWN